MAPLSTDLCIDLHKGFYVSGVRPEYGLFAPVQVIMSILIFALLSIVKPEGERTAHDELRNGIFSTVAFIVGALTSVLSGYLGMTIATYANARTTVEARKGIAPAFAVGG